MSTSRLKRVQEAAKQLQVNKEAATTLTMPSDSAPVRTVLHPGGDYAFAMEVDDGDLSQFLSFGLGALLFFNAKMVALLCRLSFLTMLKKTVFAWCAALGSKIRLMAFLYLVTSVTLRDTVRGAALGPLIWLSCLIQLIPSSS